MRLLPTVAAVLFALTALPAAASCLTCYADPSQPPHLGACWPSETGYCTGYCCNAREGDGCAIPDSQWECGLAGRGAFGSSPTPAVGAATRARAIVASYFTAGHLVTLNRAALHRKLAQPVVAEPRALLAIGPRRCSSTS